jgi:hypothetical protein
MKRLKLLFFSFCLLSYSASYSNNIEIHDSKLINYHNSFITDPIIGLYDSIPESKEIKVYSFLNNVDSESAMKLDQMIMSKMGIYSCVTDIVLKTTTITFKEGLNQKKSIDELFEIAEHRFF